MPKKRVLELWGIRGSEEAIRECPWIYLKGWLAVGESDTDSDIQLDGVGLWFSREEAGANANTVPDFPETAALWGRATIERAKVKTEGRSHVEKAHA